MIDVLPPYRPEPPSMPPGMAVSVAPAGHQLWLQDYEYYDQLGRDPLQKEKIWGISDPQERVERVKALLSEYPKAKHRRAILFKAAVRGDDALVRFLVDTGLDVHPDIQQAQQEEASGEAEDDADHGSIVDKIETDIAPLHAAANNGRLECVKIMIESGVDVNARDEFGRTPLIAAASPAETEVIRYLLSQGADPTARLNAKLDITREYWGEYAGANALEAAAPQGNVEVLRMLLEHLSPELKKEQQDGEESRSRVCVTSLAIRGAAGASFAALQLLMSHGGYPMDSQEDKPRADLLNAEQKETITEATAVAMQTGDLESLKFLLSYQYPVDSDGNLLPFTVPESLYKAVTYGSYNAIITNQIEKFEFLRSLGVKEHATMSLDGLPYGQTISVQHLLDSAAEAGAVDGLRYVLDKYGADPNAHRMPPGVKPLWNAAAYGKVDAVRYLLQNRTIDIHAGNGRYTSGPTALWSAIALKSLKCVALLLQHGGPVDYIDEDILDPEEPISVILRALVGSSSKRPSIRLELESNVSEHIRKATNDYMNMNPMYVRMQLGPSDKAWISALQLRKPDEALRETGPNSRELSRAEAAKKSELPEGDPRHLVPAFPTVEARNKELRNDDDLIPEFEPCMVPVKGRSEVD